MLTPVEFSDLLGFRGDDHSLSFSAFCSSGCRMVHSPYKTRGLGIDADVLRSVAQRALDISPDGNVDCATAKEFFEKHFIPHRVRETGFLTGFFEPIVSGSVQRTSRFSYPIYGRPSELQKNKDGSATFYDRGEINNGALKDRGLEIAYVEDAVTAFFIHVQGCANLRLEDGGNIYLTFAGKSGHDYTSLGGVLCDRLGMDRSMMTADFLRQWMMGMLDNPDNLDEFLSHNRSYIFFEIIDHSAFGAAKVPMVPHRSLAVDRRLHTFGSPIWISPHSLADEDVNIVPRLMVAHDTGSAIIGASRGDVFMGSGDEAGLLAGRIRHNSDFFVLVPRQDY